MNTPEGGSKQSATIRKKYGDDFWSKIGTKGGKAKVPKGFGAIPKNVHKELSAKGGTISRRTK